MIVAAAAGALAARRRRVLALGVLVAAVLGALVWSASPASAHAALVGTDPSDRSQLDTAPTTVTLTFNEAVEVPSGALRVYDAEAQRVDTGPADTNDPALVAVSLPGDLPDGGYVVTYRVLSADAHPIGGVVTFTVGDGAAVDDATVGELASGTGSGAARPIGSLLRGLTYLSALLAVGAALHSSTVARRASDRAVARRVGIRSALLAAGLVLLTVPVQAVAVAGDGFGAAVDPTGLAEVVTSSFGIGALSRAALLVWLVVVWRTSVPPAVPALVGVIAVASYALDGHQRTVEPTWLLVGGDILHVAAAASWFGGLVLLGIALRTRSTLDDPVEAAGLVARFSAVALVSFGLVAAGGIAMSIPLVGTPAALVGTTYGWLLVAKVVAVALVVVLAVYNRQRLVPAIVAVTVPSGGSLDAPPQRTQRLQARSQAAWGQLRRTVRVEAGILVVVLLITGVLVTVQPASDAAGRGGLFEASAALGDDLAVDLVVDPNEVGLNALHLYVVDAVGRPSQDVEDLALELTYVPEGIGPIPIEPFFAGPGHWVANTEDFVFDGDWEVRVIAGLDRFTERSATLTVPVAP